MRAPEITAPDPKLPSEAELIVLMLTLFAVLGSLFWFADRLP